MSLTATSWLWIRQPETLSVERRRPMSLTAIGDGLLTIMGNHRVLGCIVAMGLNFGAFLAYLGTSEKLLIGLYDVGAQFALYFALLAMSVGLASFTNATLVMKLGMARLIRVAQLTIFVFSLLLLVCLALQPRLAAPMANHGLVDGDFIWRWDPLW